MKSFCKTAITILLFIGILSILSSCDKTNSKKVRGVFITKTLNNDYHKLLINGVKRKAAELNFDINVVAPENEEDYAFQVKFIKEISLDDGIKLVLVAPNHPRELIESLKSLCLKNKKVIIVDTPLEKGLDATIDCNCGFVGTDNIMGGELAAKLIINKLKTGGNIILVRGINNHRSSVDREKGFLRGINGKPNFKIVGYVDGYWDRHRANIEYMKFVKNKKIKIDAVFAYSDQMALGIVEQYRNRTSRPLIVGYDGNLEAQRKILLGEMDGTIIQQPERLGRLTIEKISNCVLSKDKVFPLEYLSTVSLMTTNNSLEGSNDIE